MLASTRATLALAAPVFAAVLLASGDARAQYICANFFPTESGTYADRLEVTVGGTTAIGTEHGVTGFRLGGDGGTRCATYDFGQRVARFDIQLVGVDPGEGVFFEVDGALHEEPRLIRNPDVTAQPVRVAAGQVRSDGVDGSVALEVQEPVMNRLRMCVAAGGGDGVVVAPVVNAFCQCGNGNRHVNEDCDDGDLDSGDGCSASCELEPGWSCTGNPSVCTDQCGDGDGDAGEGCDDGNLAPDDGCSPSCRVEPFWMCEGFGPGTCRRDRDRDGVADVDDLCPDAFDPRQEDGDSDGAGDACDNCLDIPNPGQADGNGNGIGTACDPSETSDAGVIDAGGPDAPTDASIDAAPVDAPIDAAVDAGVDAAPDAAAPDAKVADARIAVDAGDDDGGGGCSTGRGTSSGGLLLLLVLASIGISHRGRGD